MTELDPQIVRNLRKAKGWSQDKLAQEAKIDKQTISRLERGDGGGRRPSTVEKLSKALGADIKVLTGEAPPPSMKEETFWDPRAPFSMRIDRAARNAISLAAARYRVQSAQIIELAPFLFVWAAETSLRQRKERLALLEERMAAAQSLSEELGHLSSIVGYSPLTNDIVDAELESIRARDLFAQRMLEHDEGNILKSDFEPSDDGPIVRLMKELAGQISEIASFEDWSPGSPPNYKVCEEEALKVFGGEGDIAEAVVAGNISLAKLPQNLRHLDMVAERQAWARLELAAYRMSAAAEFQAMGLNLDDLLDDDTDVAP